MIARASTVCRLVVSLTVVMVLSVPGSGRAQGVVGLGEEDMGVSSRRAYGWLAPPEMQLAVRGQLGVGTPLGVIGAEVEFSPVGRAALAVGVGTGWAGTQLAGTARVRVVQGGPGRVLHALVVGLGASYGPYRRYVVDNGWFLEGDGPLDLVAVGSAAWLNLEAAYELRTIGGFSLRAFTGWGLLLNPSALRLPDPLPSECDDAAECPVGRRADMLPFVGVALGFWVG